jgi:hypothetical protein
MRGDGIQAIPAISILTRVTRLYFRKERLPDFSSELNPSLKRQKKVNLLWGKICQPSPRSGGKQVKKWEHVN